MSKLPKISANNSDLIKNTLGLGNNGNESYKFDGNNDISNIQNYNFNNFNTLPPLNKEKLSNTSSSLLSNREIYANPLITDSKINYLETKLISLENTNTILKDKLLNNERSFELQLKELNQALIEERDNRIKVENMIRNINDQSSFSNNELKNKIFLIQDIVEKEEKWKYEQRQHDIELYRNLINKLTEKVSETVKLEIDARFKADMDNKALTQALAQKIYEEIDGVRKEMDDLSANTKVELKDNSKDCSERALNLSKYIEISLNEAFLIPNQNIDKLKNFVSKLAEQIKNHMVAQNNQNKVFDEKINSLDNSNANLREEVYKFANSIEDRISKKIRELQNYTEVNMRKNFDSLNYRLNLLSNNTDSNIKILAEQLIDSRNRLNLKLDGSINNNKTQFKFIIEDIETIADRVYKYEQLLQDYDNLNNMTKTKIEKDLAVIQSTFEVKTANDKLVQEMENQTIRGEISDLGSRIDYEIKDIIEKNNQDITYFNNKVELTNENINIMREENNKIFTDYELTFQNIYDFHINTETTSIMNSILNKIENDETLSQIYQIKQNEKYFKDNMTNLEDVIIKIGDRLDEKVNELEVLGVMNDMINSVEVQQSEEKIVGCIEKIQTQLESYIDDKDKFNEEIEFKFQMIKSEIENIIEEVKVDRENKKKEDEEKSENLKKKMLAEENAKKEEAVQKETVNEVEKVTTNEVDTVFNIELLQQEFYKLNEINLQKFEEINNNLNQIEVNNVINDILNKLEFENLCNLISSDSLKKFNFDDTLKSYDDKFSELSTQISIINNDNLETANNTKKNFEEMNEKLENKIYSVMEKIKTENLNMWSNAVELSQKVNQPEEIRKILNQVPPIIYTRAETNLKIMEISNDNTQFSKPEILKLKEINLTKQTKNESNHERKITPHKSDKNIEEII